MSDNRRYAVHYFRSLNPDDLTAKGRRLASRLLGLDDVIRENGGMLLSTTARQILEAIEDKPRRR